MLFATQKPEFQSSACSTTSGYSSRTISGVPSVLALSTTCTSISALDGGLSRRDARHARSRSRAPVEETMTTSRPGTSLEGTLAGENRRKCHEQDPQVPPERQVLDVLPLHRKPLVEVEVATPEDLHRPGHPRPRLEAEAVLLAVAIDELELLGPRSHEAHVSLEHVHQLRKLVEAPTTQDAPYARHAGVVA